MKLGPGRIQDADALHQFDVVGPSKIFGGYQAEGAAQIFAGSSGLNSSEVVLIYIVL